MTRDTAQARPASDEGAFMPLGRLVEHSSTEEMFVPPRHKGAADDIEGRHG